MGVLPLFQQMSIKQRQEMRVGSISFLAAALAPIPMELLMMCLMSIFNLMPTYGILVTTVPHSNVCS